MAQKSIFDTRNLALGAALVFVLGLIALDEWWLDEARTTFAPLDIAAEKVRRIRIKAGDREPIWLERNASTWWIQRPVQIQADQRRVEQLLDVLEQSVSALHIDSRPIRAASLVAKDRAAFGLGDQALQLEFEGQALLIGNRSPVRDLRYASSDDRVFLLRLPNLPSFAEQGLQAWVSPWPFASSQAIRNLRIRADDAQRKLDGGELGIWLRQLRAASVQKPSAELRAISTDKNGAPMRMTFSADVEQGARSYEVGRLGNLIVLRREKLKLDYYLGPRSSRELLERLQAELSSLSPAIKIDSLK